MKKPMKIQNFQANEAIARISDLPDAPFQLELQSITTNPDNYDQVQIFYTTMMSVQELADFYQQQMERHGWELLAESHAQNWLFHYSKPSQLCSILILDHKMDIYLCNKKGA